MLPPWLSDGPGKCGHHAYKLEPEVVLELEVGGINGPPKGPPTLPRACPSLRNKTATGSLPLQERGCWDGQECVRVCVRVCRHMHPQTQE